MINVREYWDKRHQALDDLRSGGDRGISEGENYAFYVHRLSQTLRFLHEHFYGKRPLHILDAGCGKGFFSEGLVRSGYEVDGVDSSSAAIRIARKRTTGEFYCAPLESFKAKRLYDVILCIDVLFHILEDSKWEASLENFINSVSTNGLIIVTDAAGPERLTLGDYIIHRSLDQYMKFFGDRGFSLLRTVPFRMGVNPNKFLVFAPSTQDEDSQ
jgi:2-polyprenyl-3-methyl-5-hydroxy-6-metoxy-1,4-benzoquinol methylase